MKRPKKGEWVKVSGQSMGFIGYVDYCTQYNCYVFTDRGREEFALCKVNELGSYIDDEDKEILRELYIDMALRTRDKEWFMELGRE